MKPEQVAAVVEAFRRPGLNFLMPPVPEPLLPETLLDISHESLIRQWGRMKGWVETEAASAEQYRRLEQTADLWNKGRAALWTKPDLDDARKWLAAERPTERRDAMAATLPWPCASSTRACGIPRSRRKQPLHSVGSPRKKLRFRTGNTSGTTVSIDSTRSERGTL